MRGASLDDPVGAGCANHLMFIATGEKARMSRLATIFAVVACGRAGIQFNNVRRGRVDVFCDMRSSQLCESKILSL